MCARRIKDYNTGDLLAMRIKVDEDPLIKKWGNSQSNVGDAIRYLIEEEIRQNGIRNLARCVNSERPKLSTDTTNNKKMPPSLLRGGQDA